MNTATLAKKRFAAAGNWAIARGLLTANPLKGLRTGRGRTRELVLPTPEQTRLLLSKANPALRDLIEALHDTGCRPIEVFSLTAADFKGDRWLLRQCKSGRPRTIHLTPRVQQRCRELAAANPTGPLYRRLDGQPWQPHSRHPLPAVLAAAEAVRLASGRGRIDRIARAPD